MCVYEPHVVHRAAFSRHVLDAPWPDASRGLGRVRPWMPTAYGGSVVVLLLIASVMLFLVEILAIADVIGRTEDEFRRVGRGSRTVWLGVLGTAILVSILLSSRPVLGLVGVIAAAYYFLDVRPRLKALRGE
jgi:hypothetical protein